MVGLVSFCFRERALRPRAAALPLPANADGGAAISVLTAASKLVPRRATLSRAARLSAGESPVPAPAAQRIEHREAAESEQTQADWQQQPHLGW